MARVMDNPITPSLTVTFMLNTVDSWRTHVHTASNLCGRYQQPRGPATAPGAG